MSMMMNPTQGIAPPSKPDEDKVQLLMTRYSTVWLSRIVKTGLFVYLVHVFVSSILRGMTQSWSLFGDGSLLGTVLDMLRYKVGLFDGWTAILASFRGFSGGILTSWTLWISLACMIQIAVVACVAKVAKIKPTTRREAVAAIFGSGLSGGLFATVFMGLANATLCHCYLNIVDLSGMANGQNKSDSLSCPGIGGPSDLCWTEQNRIVISASAICSMFAFITVYFRSNFVLCFPTIDVSFTERIRFAFYIAIRDSSRYMMIFVCVNFGVYYVLSVLFIVTTKPYFSYISDFGFFYNVTFLLNILFWPSFMVYSMNLCWRLAEIFLTEKLDLPLESKFSSAAGVITLSDAMKLGPLPMKYVGFFEFNMMACMPSTCSVTQQFFSLSHPGRHARNWSGVLDASLNECSALTKSLSDFILKQRTGSTSSVPSKPSSSNTATIQEPENDHKSGTLRRRTLAQTQMRDLTTPLMHTVSDPGTRSVKGVLLIAPQILATGFRRLVTTFCNYQFGPIMKRIKSFTDSKDSECELNNILTSGKLVVWGTNGIVEIACSSFHFDTHGIVQQDIRRIISALLTLHETLIRVSQIMVGITRIPTTKNPGRKYSQLRHLVTNITYSLTRIHGAFFLYYALLEIPPVEQEKLRAIAKIELDRNKPIIFNNEHFSRFIPMHQ